MDLYRAEVGSDFVYGLELVSVNRAEIAEDDYIECTERLLSSVDGHPFARLILQTAIDPDPAAPQRGKVSVHLFVIGPRDAAAAVEELVEDLHDFLSMQPRPWTFQPIEDPEKLLGYLDPFAVAHHAEIVRREAPCPTPEGLPQVGYHIRDDSRPNVEAPWSMWRFDARDRSEAAMVLLSQDAPIAIRTIVSIAELTGLERDLLEHLVVLTGSEESVRGIRAASGRVFERMLSARPLYDTRILVASPSPIGASVLSAIGWSISPPQDRDGGGPLAGGFETIRNPVDGPVLWDSLNPMAIAPGDVEGPAELRSHIRHILTMTEAAAAFALPRPSAAGNLGVRSRRIPVAEPPLADLPSDGVLLGTAHIGAESYDVRLPMGDRMRHLYLTGQTGTGKSTVMGNLILDDIERGAGVAVVDPHGSLIQSVLERIPEERIDDVIVIEPADSKAVVGVNLLEAENAIQQTFVVSELAAMFYTIFDPSRSGIVGPVYETWLRHGAQLLLANRARPSSMLDIPTLFTDPAVQRLLVAGIDDVVLSEFWRGEIAQTTDFHKSEVIGWFRAKFEPFRLAAPVRRIVGQATSTISFDDALRERRIILVNLSKGYLGSYNANLIGFVVLTRLWQATLSRARLSGDDRPDFFIYVDEFQSLTTNSLAEMLSEARKFEVGVTVANQFLAQVSDDLQAAIVGNVSTKVAFRLGPTDADLFASWMGAEVEPEDLTRLRNFTAMASIANRGEPLDPLILNTRQLPGAPDPARAERIRERSRQLWGKPVEEIDRLFGERWADVEGSFAHRLANPDRGHPSRR